MDKCQHEVGICHQQLASVIGGPRNLPLKFGQNRPGTAEIFMIWTIVAWTNVAWTNVTVTVGICLGWSQEPSFKVWL